MLFSVAVGSAVFFLLFWTGMTFTRMLGLANLGLKEMSSSGLSSVGFLICLSKTRTFGLQRKMMAGFKNSSGMFEASLIFYTDRESVPLNRSRMVAWKALQIS